MNLNCIGQVKKYKHYKDKWYALYQMNKEVWSIVVYAEDEEKILFSCIELTEGEAIHTYNKIKKEIGGKTMKKNYQKELVTFWNNACYALCVAFLNSAPEVRNDIYYLVVDVLQGWRNGFIDDDCYVSKPHKYASMCLGDEKAYKDVEKVPLKKLEDLPEGEWAVEWKCPTGGSHFTVETKETIMTDEPLFDPSYLSNSRKNKQVVSYRRFIRR